MVRFTGPGWRAFAGLVACAALLGLYSRGGYAFALGFVALVPWLLVLDTRASFASAARSGLLMSMAFAAAVFAWFGAAIGAYTQAGTATGLVVLLAGAPLLQPQFLAFAVARQLAGRSHGAVLRALAGASAWVGTEWFVPKLLGDTLGHGLYPSPLLRQVADLGGAAGLTFLLILVNEAVAHAIARRRVSMRAWMKPAAIAGSLLVLMAGYGAARLSSLSGAPQAAPSLRVGMVQSNIVDYERLRREMGAYEVVRHVLDTHFDMSREAVARDRVDALLWSETVYPTTFAHPKSEGGAQLDREILDFVTAIQVPTVFGTYDVDEAGEYNAAAFVEPASGLLGFYRKSNLFLLTERVPRWIDGPMLRRRLPWTGTWIPGSGARVFPLRLADGREIPVLPLICLDDVDPGLAVDGARLGAQLILTMSNDSWFTDYPVGAQLHLTVAAFRSIETRLPQLRVTNNGMSAVIDATGRIVASTAVGEKKLLVGRVQPKPDGTTTLMVRWGDWVGPAGFAVLALLAVLAALSAITRRAAMAEPRAAESAGPFRCTAVVVTPAWYAALVVLRVFTFAGVAWLGAAVLWGDTAQTHSLKQIWMFAALVLAPEAAAWSIRRALRATLLVDGATLVLEQREQRIEVPLQEIAELRPWPLAFPLRGFWLQMRSGRQLAQGIAVAEATSLMQALSGVSGRDLLADDAPGPASAYARVRMAVLGPWMDHPGFKFIIFSLVPALPAFRLHQHIAFGGSFGEYYSFGLKAYLIALVIWWASWMIGMVLFAAALRIAIETATMLTVLVRPARAGEARATLEWLGRLLFFVGVPCWLLLRMLG